MKNLLTVIALFVVLTAAGQTSANFYQEGIAKHKAKDYKGAIKEYDKAIKADKTNKDAFFNRGSCHLALDQYEKAMDDYTKALELDPKFAKAYYSRATVLASQNKFIEALPDLDKAIENDPTLPNALTLRGQIRAQAGNTKGACDDFNQAKAMGDKQADQYLSKFCTKEDLAVESLILEWPASEKWILAADQENEQQVVRDYIREGETLQKWTELGNMTVLKGITGVEINKAMNLMYEQSKKNAPKAKLTFIEKDETAAAPWIIFTIESPEFKNDKVPESQLWYIIQGRQALYTNFRAVKEASITSEQKAKWTSFFKTAKLDYK